MTRVTEEYPGLTYMVVRSFRHSRRASLDVQVLFKPLLVIYLLISYWPKQAIWPTQREGVEIQTPLLDGKICHITLQGQMHRKGHNVWPFL